MNRWTLIAIAIVAVAAAGACTAYSPTDPEFRAYWVDAWHDGFKSTAQADALISHVRACKLNAIVVQMRRRGDTFYPSPYEPFATGAQQGFDMLAYLVQKAHTGSPRIEVHCWFTALPIASDTLPSQPSHPYYRYPEYLTRDDDGNTLIAENYWFDPGHPMAEEFTYNVVIDVVNRYDVDGIHLDYIRFGSRASGYNEVSVARFNALNGRTGQPDYLDSAWSDWRRTQVTNLVRKIYANAIAVKPAIKVSAATLTWSPPVSGENFAGCRPYYQVFQDWRSWMDEGILDLNIPMTYYDCNESISGDFDTWLCYTINNKYDREAAIGVNACGQSDPMCVAEQIGATRVPPCAGTNRSYGYCVYSYACADPSVLCPLNSVAVPVPAMPWKTSPTRGHIKGTVTLGTSTWVDGATVTLTGPESRTIKTDGTGFYAFIDLAPGDYTVAASKPGMSPGNAAAAVSVGQVTTANIVAPPPPLTITNIAVGGELANRVTVTWTTNLQTTSRVVYGPDKNCTSSTTEDTALVSAHTVNVTGLQPLTAYYFRVVSRTGEGIEMLSPVYAFVSGADIPDIVIDNPQAAFVNNWVYATTSPDKYGSDYHYSSTNLDPIRYATFTPTIVRAGNYEVYVWYPQGGNRSSQSPFTINFSGGSQLYPVNQQTNGGKWNLLDTKPFAAGTSGNVQLTSIAPGGSLVVADAVRFKLLPETVAPSVPQGLQAQPAAFDRVNLSWQASTDNVGVAGYRIYRDGMVTGISPTNSFVDTDLLGNTRYTYSVSAFDTSANRSAQSGTAAVCTYSTPPSYTTITCNRPAGVWSATNPFTFTAVGGMGFGRVAYYMYVWDTSIGHTWDGSESMWMTPTKSINAVASSQPYYLHVLGFNADNVANGSADFGPYYFDNTAPPAPEVTCGGVGTSSGASVSAAWSGEDAESGAAEWQYCVGTSPGAADVVSWTTTPESSANIEVAQQAPGTLLYVSAKSQNAAGLWGSVGTSEGISLSISVDTIAAAKALQDDTVISLENKLISAVYGSFFFISEDDRSAGIRVEAATGLSVGDRVSVTGLLDTVAGERRIIIAMVTQPN